MLGNYALSLYRTLSRHKLYALLNTFGLALGIAVCTVLFLVVRFESGFDHWSPYRDTTFRVNRISTFPGAPRREAPKAWLGMNEKSRCEPPRMTISPVSMPFCE